MAGLVVGTYEHNKLGIMHEAYWPWGTPIFTIPESDKII